MIPTNRSIVRALQVFAVWALVLLPFARSQEDSCATIPRSLPPEGIEIPDTQSRSWLRQVDELAVATQSLDETFRPDIEVLLKACRFAVSFRELYSAKDFAKVDRLLELAEDRIAEAKNGNPQWPQAAGRQVRGFRSKVDGSVQPLGLVLPAEWQGATKLPLYVWLHGRGDKSTDLHFICERLDKDGQIVPPGAIVLHPFGRQCIGYKSAGETDVMEAVDYVCENYPVDKDRIVLMGFSMGGAGVWHLAAHYGERFVAASPGAGFAETARYQCLQPDQFPPIYEQMLWSVYDVPGYTRNLLNLPVIAYSGEMDKQIQAAQVMGEAFKQEGAELVHLIGPGMGHKYHPDTLQEILRRLASVVEQGKAESPQEFFIQSKHPRYSARNWLTIDGAAQQYADTRADAVRDSSGRWTLTTKNVSRLKIDTTLTGAPRDRLIVDGGNVQLGEDATALLEKSDSGRWRVVQEFAPLRKYPGLSGPIDDAFIDPFLVVLPTNQSPHEKVEHWVQCELKNFEERWRMLFRGQLRIKRDTEVTQQDMQDYHLVLWGDPHSNRVTQHMLAAGQKTGKSPLHWSNSEIQVGNSARQADSHVLLAIYPNPLNPERYVVFNSGPTFRQAHDRTNSLQNPHLPDWAIVSLDEAPSAEVPGEVVSTGFFDDAWQFDPQLTYRQH